MREACDLSADRNLDPRNTMDPRWQPLLPICPRFRPCSSVRGSFPNPIIPVRRVGGGEKGDIRYLQDYLDSGDFSDDRGKEGIEIFLFLDAWYWIVDGIFFFVESDMEKCEIYNKNKIIDPILHIFAKFLISNTF